MLITLELFLEAPLRYLRLVFDGERVSVITPMGVVDLVEGFDAKEATWEED